MGLSFEEFERDDKKIFAVARAIEIIGEAVKNVPESIRSKYPEIPWKAIAGMRDKFIHQYWGTDIQVLWKTTQQDVPQLKVLSFACRKIVLVGFVSVCLALLTMLRKRVAFSVSEAAPQELGVGVPVRQSRCRSVG